MRRVSHPGWRSDAGAAGRCGGNERTAQRYIAVAEAFKYDTLSDLDAITIEAIALYALAAPDVPQSARDQAISQAKAGEHITRELLDPAKAA